MTRAAPKSKAAILGLPPLSEPLPDEHDVHVIIGQRLRLRRVELGLSQEELAGQTGMTFQQLQKYEKGTNRISAGKLYRFSRMLHVEIGYFYQELLPHPEGADDKNLATRSNLEIMKSLRQVSQPVRKAIANLVVAVANTEKQEQKNINGGDTSHDNSSSNPSGNGS